MPTNGTDIRTGWTSRVVERAVRIRPRIQRIGVAFLVVSALIAAVAYVAVDALSIVAIGGFAVAGFAFLASVVIIWMELLQELR